MVAAFGDDFSDKILFAVGVFSDNGNGNIVTLGDGKDVRTNFFSDGLGELRKIEYADTPLIE